METPILNIAGEKVALGPVERAFTELYRRWMNDWEVVRTLGRIAKPVTETVQAEWVDRVTKGDGGNATFTLHAKDGGGWRPVGVCGLHDIELVHGTASFGIVIGEADARGRGLGTEATRLTVDYGFTVLGLHNILLSVHASNPGAIRCYEKAGFRHIGRRRGARRLANERVDEVYMDVLAAEHVSPALAKVFRPIPPR